MTHLPRISSLLLPLLLTLLLGGCSSVGGVFGSKSKPSPTPERAPASSTKAPDTATAPAGKKSGGYYLDDGPGDNPPADLDAIPDAVPMDEPPLARANRPYVALGENYTPMTRPQPYKAQGVASWYGRRYHGQKTSSGEVYDMYGMTAAHPILPIPSYVRVTNPENGKSVVVRVNDRGPFKKDRLIDLSYAAAHKLRIVGKGSGQVEVEAILPGASQPVATTEPVQPTLNMDKTLETAPPSSGSFVQVGAFKSKDNADLLRDKLRQQNLAENVVVENWYTNGIYRVRLGPYNTRDDAIRAAGEIKQSLGVSTLVITQ